MDADSARLLTQRIYIRLNNRRPDIEKAENYYHGKQPLSFATEEWQKANAARYAGFSDNWCASVVNAEAERLKPTGFTNIDKGSAKLLWDHLQFNEFDMQFSQGVITTLTAKRTFVIVWGDRGGEPVVTFEHPSNVEIEYDWENPRLRKAALKTWVDEDKEYATLYTPDELWKFERPRQVAKNDRDSQAEQSQSSAYVAEGGWQARVSTGDDTWPLRNPLGVVPVVEIGNRPTLKGDPVSEIEGVMPMQDAINLLWAYLFLAADYASMDARVILGAEPPKIPILDKATGAVIGFRPVDMKDLREKRLITVSGENAKIDQWTAAKLDIFTDTISVGVGHISSQTRTPPTYLVSETGMSNVNGEGLKAAEIPLVMKANEFITFTDPSLREVASLVARVLGNESLAREVRLASVTWASREIRSESQMADALLKKKQTGYPLEYLMELDGLDPATIDRVLAMAEAEQRDLQIEAATRELSAIATGTPSES
tara:strand:+ start:2779 stop:4236 length:1458 start_codon:yes stop_codon:yes gene_type:complete